MEHEHDEAGGQHDHNKNAGWENVAVGKNISDTESVQAEVGSEGGAASVHSTAGAADPTRPSDEQIISFENEIKDEQRQSPLLGDKEVITSLRADYQDSSPTFVAKVEYLCTKYSFIRRTRGDGNCFYRSFVFGLLEALLATQATQTAKAMIEQLSSLKKLLIDAGFQELVFEDAMDVLKELLEAVASTSATDRIQPAELLLRLNEEDIGNMVVMLVRLVASAYISQREDHFLPFVLGMLDDCHDVDSFRRRYVEAMGEESDHIQVVAVAEALNVPVMVVYLDNSDGTPGADGTVECNNHLFQGEAAQGELTPPQVTVLYRPGHYDILYT